LARPKAVHRLAGSEPTAARRQSALPPLILKFMTSAQPDAEVSDPAPHPHQPRHSGATLLEIMAAQQGTAIRPEALSSRRAVKFTEEYADDEICVDRSRRSPRCLHPRDEQSISQQVKQSEGVMNTSTNIAARRAADPSGFPSTEWDIGAITGHHRPPLSVMRQPGRHCEERLRSTPAFALWPAWIASLRSHDGAGLLADPLAHDESA